MTLAVEHGMPFYDCFIFFILIEYSEWNSSVSLESIA